MLTVLILWGLLLQGQGELRGVVRDAQSGESLSHVSIQLVGGGRQSLSGPDGQFDLGGVGAGEYTLKISTVGYRLLEKRIELKSGTTQEVEVLLSPDTFRRTDKVEVRADAFDMSAHPGPSAFTIKGNEAKNLASVLADDPLRSVQSIPGVSSNDDFDDRFSVHGAPYERVGLYLDGILLHQPFHTVQGEGPSGSMAVFNGDMVESMTLESEGYSSRFADRTAGVLDVHTRDGGRTQVNVRATAGAADAGLLAEGPLGRSHEGSWLASVRKSYLQYLLQRVSDQSTMAFGFTDAQVQLSYDLGRSQNVRLSVIDGTSNFDRSHWRSELGLNSSILAKYRFTLANLGWQYAPAPSLLLSSHAAFMRERYDNSNSGAQPLEHGDYGEWVWNTNATWMWSSTATLNFGASARRIRSDGFANYFYNPSSYVRPEEHSGTELLAGGYAQQSWGVFSKRVILTAGVRWDHLSVSGTGVTSPQGSIAFLPWRTTRLHLGWGQYAQFPDGQYLFSKYGSPSLLPERATHYVAALEQGLGPLTRFRISAYRRNDRDLLFRPYMDARLVDGAILGDNFAAPLTNSVRGYAKGLEFFLQRRTANRLTGWVSYALGYAEMRDSVTGLHFPSEQDQRHTVNVYLGYRIRPSVNLSMKWTYGSGFPVPGFFRQAGGTYYLAPQRNAVRLGPYQRTDARINKERVFDRWKMTFYAEVVNVFNRNNYRFDSYNGYNGSTGEAYLSFANMFPVLPSAGLMVEF